MMSLACWAFLGARVGAITKRLSVFLLHDKLPNEDMKTCTCGCNGKAALSA